MMKWSDELKELRDALAELYPGKDVIPKILDDAGVPTGKLELSGGSDNWWHIIVRFAENNDRVARLIDIAMKDYGGNKRLRDAADRYSAARSKVIHTVDPKQPPWWRRWIIVAPAIAPLLCGAGVARWLWPSRTPLLCSDLVRYSEEACADPRSVDLHYCWMAAVAYETACGTHHPDLAKAQYLYTFIHRAADKSLVHPLIEALFGLARTAGPDTKEAREYLDQACQVAGAGAADIYGKSACVLAKDAPGKEVGVGLKQIGDLERRVVEGYCTVCQGKKPAECAGKQSCEFSQRQCQDDHQICAVLAAKRPDCFPDPIAPLEMSCHAHVAMACVSLAERQEPQEGWAPSRPEAMATAKKAEPYWLEACRLAAKDPQDPASRYACLQLGAYYEKRGLLGENVEKAIEIYNMGCANWNGSPACCERAQALQADRARR